MPAARDRHGCRRRCVRRRHHLRAARSHHQRLDRPRVVGRHRVRSWRLTGGYLGARLQPPIPDRGLTVLLGILAIALSITYIIEASIG